MDASRDVGANINPEEPGQTIRVYPVTIEVTYSETYSETVYIEVPSGYEPQYIARCCRKDWEEEIESAFDVSRIEIVNLGVSIFGPEVEILREELRRRNDRIYSINE